MAVDGERLRAVPPWCDAVQRVVALSERAARNNARLSIIAHQSHVR